MAFYLKHPAGVSPDAEKMIVNLTCVVLITATMIQLIPSLLNTLSSPSFIIPCLLIVFFYRSVIMSTRTPPVNVHTERRAPEPHEYDPGDNGEQARSPNYIAEALARVPAPTSFQAAYCESDRDSWPLFLYAYEAMCDEAGLSGEQKKAILLEFVHPDIQHLFIRAIQPVGEKPWSPWRLAIVRLMDEEDLQESNMTATRPGRNRRRRVRGRRNRQTAQEPTPDALTRDIDTIVNNACGHCGPGHSAVPCRTLPTYQEAQRGRRSRIEESHPVFLATQAPADNESDEEVMPPLLEVEDDSDDEDTVPISWSRATATVDWDFVRQQLQLRLAHAVYDSGGNAGRSQILSTRRDGEGASKTTDVQPEHNQGDKSGDPGTAGDKPDEQEDGQSTEPTPCTGMYKAKASRGGDDQGNEISGKSNRISHETPHGQGDEPGQHPGKEDDDN